ncbi:MAG TPA: glycine betaine ABC transporter substrate-binding protein [Chthoniobacterales bacterium]|nr:glycine betaine ABC transporter substrate-binding protein [Chthoniobacterales bacterium]
MKIGAVLGLAIFLLTRLAPAAEPIVVGSKKFTESYVLGEIAKTLLERAGFNVRERAGMGGTIILWQALRGGQIDLYPEYTGTIGEEILKTKERLSEEAMRDALAKLGVGMSADLGFNNTYALVMRRTEAARLGIETISDLRRHPDLKLGLTHEFLDRQDGWRPLATHYGLTMPNVSGIDHAIGYAALARGSIDIKDAYSTDAKIQENNLIVLRDGRHFFPEYKAVFLYRLKLDPRAIGALKSVGEIDEAKMIALNAAAERTKNYAYAASLFFHTAAPNESVPPRDLAPKLAGWIGRHLQLAGISLFFSILIGLPLGIAASRGGPLGHGILALVGMIQTIPSLALLALLVPVPFLGISATTAIVALFLYGLLPIVRNTATGLQDIPPALRDSATALGLEPGARLRKIYLPLASRTILAGIKTSAVINIGTATLAALIGAGGLGEPILSGLNLNDNATILEGAIPAALLALLVQGLFDLLDRFLIPRGLRLGS